MPTHSERSSCFPAMQASLEPRSGNGSKPGGLMSVMPAIHALYRSYRHVGQKRFTNRHEFSSCPNMQQDFCGAYKTPSACSAVKQLVRSCVRRKLQTLAGCRLLSPKFYKSFQNAVDCVGQPDVGVKVHGKCVATYNRSSFSLRCMDG